MKIRIVKMVLKLVNRDFLNNLTKIIVGNLEPQDTDDNALTLAIALQYSDALKVLNLLLHKYNLSHRTPQVYLLFKQLKDNNCDVTELITIDSKGLNKYIKELRAQNHLVRAMSTFKACEEFPHCPVFTHLSVVEYHIDVSVVSAFKKALQDGKLPNFRSVQLVACCGHISPVDWPKEIKVDVCYKYGDKKYCSICSPQKEDGWK